MCVKQMPFNTAFKVFIVRYTTNIMYTMPVIFESFLERVNSLYPLLVQFKNSIIYSSVNFYDKFVIPRCRPMYNDSLIGVAFFQTDCTGTDDVYSWIIYIICKGCVR